MGGKGYVMFTIGLSTCSKEINDELFAQYRQAGIEAMEISVHKLKYDEIDYALLAESSRRHGIQLWSFHLPFAPFARIDPSKPALVEGTLAYFTELISRASAIGIRNFIVHPSGEPIAPEDRPARMACARESLARLAEIAAGYGAVIAVEDLPRTCLGNCSAEIAELISAHPALRVCFDTNHLLNESAADFIARLGDKIITTHVSDYDFIDERHWLPGEGKQDWQTLLQALRDVGYTGPWLYELGFGCPKTLVRERALTCGDFARNAEELFTNRPLTVLSRPAEPAEG